MSQPSYIVFKGPKGYLNLTIGRRRGDNRSYAKSRHWEKNLAYATRFRAQDEARIKAYLAHTYSLADQCQSVRVTKDETLGSQVPKLS